MSKAQLKKLIEAATPEEMLQHLEYLHAFERWALEAREALEKIRARTDVMNIKGPTEWADKVLAKFPGEKK